MATAVQDSRYAPHNWPGARTNAAANNPDTLRPRYQPYGPPASHPRPPDPARGPPPPASLPPHNEVEMTRDKLTAVLDYFSQLLPQYFDWKIIQSIAAASDTSAKPSIPKIKGMLFVVHGGACMLLHPGLYALAKQQQGAVGLPGPGRTKTRDVDYVHRGFVAEYGTRIPDAAERLKDCIHAVARQFGLGADWMNSDADIALPMAHDPKDGSLYDPIYGVSIHKQNIARHTIYRSDNGFLTLISVTPAWAVSLKLVRYTKWDPGDICLLLRHGVMIANIQWTREALENWLYTECWAMGYANFDGAKKALMRSRMEHAIKVLAKWTRTVGDSPPDWGATRAELGDTWQQHVIAPAEAVRVRERGREPSTSDVGQWGWDQNDNAAAAPRLPPGAPEGQAHAVQWAPGSQEQKKTRSKSRPARAPTPYNQEEIEESFIPPGVEWDENGGIHDAYATFDGGRPAAQSNSRRPDREQPPHSSWLPANHGQSRTVRDPVGGGVGGGATATGPWHPQIRAQPIDSRVPDPYSMRILGHAIDGAHTQDYAEDNYAGVGAGFQSVIPGVTVADPSQQQQMLRRKQEKQRKIERQRARGSKWRHAYETESGESEGESDNDGDKENRMRDQRRGNALHDPLAAKATQSGPWHQLYAPPVAGRSTSGQQTQQRRSWPQEQPQESSSRQPGVPPNHGRSATRTVSSDNKRRPSPLDLGEPPVVPFIPPGQAPSIGSMPMPEPAFTNPSELAQWQFVQQAKNYQREREQHQVLAEREHRFYQRGKFNEVPSGLPPQPPPQQMGMYYQGQQYLHPHEQQAMYQQPPPQAYTFPPQIPAPQRPAYR